MHAAESACQAICAIRRTRRPRCGAKKEGVGNLRPSKIKAPNCETLNESPCAKNFNAL